MSFGAQQALERYIEARDVEAAFRAQASKALARYNEAVKVDPYSRETDIAWKLRKEALSQWKKTRLNAAEARQAWKLAHDMDAAAVRASIQRARARRG